MIHLRLQPEIESQLAAEAEARGLALYLCIETIVTARRPAETLRRESPAEAVAAIRELRKGNRLDGLSVKDLIHEGRKY